MRYTSETEWGTLEDHCYFPEWADRPPASGSVHEADHNSYLAGGYAEEFGHRARGPAAPLASIAVDGDGEWRVQIGGLHPGYPECPRPVDRGPGSGRARAGDGPTTRTANGPPRSEAAGFRIVRVGQDGGGKAQRQPWTPWREFRIRRHRLLLR